MCDDDRTSGHRELWTVGALPADQGPEGNFAMWAEAEGILDKLCAEFEGGDKNEAAYLAFVNAYNLCMEERRRAADPFKLREHWSRRRIGGVAEPPSPVRDY